MGEPKSEAPPQPNGGVKQKPTTLNLASGTSFYRPTVNGRASLNDRHLQQQQQQHAAAAGIGLSNGGPPSAGRASSISRLKSVIASNNPAAPTDGNEPNHAQLSALSAVLPVLSGLSTKSPVSSAAAAAAAALSNWNDLADEYDEDQRESPPPPTPASSHPATPLNRAGVIGEHTKQQQQQQQQQRLSANSNGLESPSVGQLSARSPSHNGFSLYTPPAPLPASGANKMRSVPNGLPQPAPRRPHSIAAPPYHLTTLQSITAAFAGRIPPGPSPQQQQQQSAPAGNSSSVSASAVPPSYPWTGLVNGISPAVTDPAAGPGIIGSQHRRAAELGSASAQVHAALSESELQRQQHQQQQLESIAAAGMAPAPTRSAIPPQSLWNGQLQQHQQQQQLPRRPHSIASTPVSTTCSSSSSSSTSSVSSASSSAAAAAATAAAGGAQSANGPTARTPGEPIQWGASGMVLHQPVARRAYASTLPHPHSPTPTSQGPALSALTNPGSFNTWTSGSSLRGRPHSIASTPQGNGTPPAVAASPSDSGYRSLPSASSDYQLMSKSPSLQHTQMQAQNQSATRRLSLPSAQSLLRATAPRPSPTFHGLPFKPFTCGVSPNGNPIFLGCTHLHGSTGNTNSTASSTGSIRSGTPATSPASMFNTAQAIQQLLAQHQKNGISDDKLSLFIDILDTQERFAKVSSRFLWDISNLNIQ